MSLFNDGWRVALTGILMGHFYVFLKFILPVTSRKSYLDTPVFM
jgi:hypothetical protein